MNQIKSLISAPPYQFEVIVEFTSYMKDYAIYKIVRPTGFPNTRIKVSRLDEINQALVISMALEQIAIVSPRNIVKWSEEYLKDKGLNISKPPVVEKEPETIQIDNSRAIELVLDERHYHFLCNKTVFGLQVMIDAALKSGGKWPVEPLRVALIARTKLEQGQVVKIVRLEEGGERIVETKLREDGTVEEFIHTEGNVLEEA